ncbi:MAG: glutathione S-transferase [Proteobacteria bacterium]|nr:glutathione S-transferase [Pseudomonadota bacterium]
MIRVWGRRNSLNVQKVMWTLGELDLDYERHDMGGSFGFTDAYRQINPNSVVPAIQDGDLTLYESNSCVRYLSHQYGQGTLLPDDVADAARADQWMDWQCSTLSGAFFPIFINLIRLPAGQQDQGAADRGIRQTAALLQRLELHLEGRDYLLGNNLTMGDIPLACHLYRWFEMDIPRPEMPNLQRYYENLCSRPAYRYHVMIPFGSNVDEWNQEEERNRGIQ